MATGIGPAGRIGGYFIDSKLTPLLVVAALILGALAISLTPREEEPQIVVPVFDIFTGLPGAQPDEVETRVTIPLEKRLAEIAGVEYLYSTSMPGMSMVTVRFLVGSDQERSLVGVYDKIASGIDATPAGATLPLIRTRTIDDVPVLGLTLWSTARDADSLRRLAMELRREISRIDDVSAVTVIGGSPRQVRVTIDAPRAAGLGIDPGDVIGALQSQNRSTPAGTAQIANREVLVETGALLASVDEVASLVIAVRDGAPIYLRDIATITDDVAEYDRYVQFVPGPAMHGDAGAPASGSWPAVTVAIAKRKGADAAAVVDRVNEHVARLRGPLLPEDVQVSVTRDYGSTAREKADELLLHLIVAILSVSLVIWASLGWRGALVVFVSVPVSFALTLFVYWALGYTLNRVTLFALIFVTGIVVDDSIIVVENIVRHFSMKKLPPRQAAITAVNEVGNPTILATLTVIASVLPMAFVSGLMGPYMRPMPVGASLAMIFSLMVAFIAAPWFGYRLLRGAADHGEEYDLESTRTYRVYRRLLLPLIRRPLLRWGSLGVVVLILLLSVALFPLRMVTVKMLPFDNKSELQLIVDMPEGTTLESTGAVARDLAVALGDVPEITDMQLYVGTAAPVNFNGLVRHYDLRQGPNVADVQVNFVHKEERSAQSHDLARRIRPAVEAVAARHGASVKIAEVPPGPPVMATLVAEIYGPDEASRTRVADQVRQIFESADSVVDVDWSVEAAQPRVQIEVALDKAALHGISADRVQSAVRMALTGAAAGTLHAPQELEPPTILVRMPIAERSRVSALTAIRLRGADGSMVPLSELTRVVETTREPARFRKNQLPVVYVTGDVAGREESPVYAILDMAPRVAEIALPGDVALQQHYRDEPVDLEVPAMKWDGEWHITYEVFRDLGVAFGLVLVLIYFLIIGWFGSFTVPLVMMIAIPLALVGVLPGHWMLGAFFTATSMIGFIALAGIMVRNSVLLIDFVNLARDRGTDLETSVIEAGAVRFRPILLTAGTVVVGAVVILFDPIFQGLAIALMGGAIASTVLTLLVVPLVYYMTEARAARRGKSR